MVEAKRRTVWRECRRSPFQCCSRTPQTRGVRIVFGVIGRIVGQLNGQAELIGQLDQAGHELGASGVVFWPVVKVEEQGLDERETFSDALPEGAQAIPDKIGAQF